MFLLNLLRTALFCVLLVFSLIVLGILCYFTAEIGSAYGLYVNAFALGIATSLLTVITVLTVIIVDRVRKGAVISRVWFELLWVGFLWILWIATAGSLTSLGVAVSCNSRYVLAELICRLYQGSQAFSWLNWLALFGWFIILLTVAIVHQSKGNGQVWHTPTTDLTFSVPKTTTPPEATTVAPQFTGATAYTAAFPGATNYHPQSQYGSHTPHQSQYGVPQGYPNTTQPYPGSPPPQQYGLPQQYPQQYPQQHPQQGAPQQYPQGTPQQYPAAAAQQYPPQGAPQQYPQHSGPQQGTPQANYSQSYLPQQGYGQPPAATV